MKFFDRFRQPEESIDDILKKSYEKKAPERANKRQLHELKVDALICFKNGEREKGNKILQEAREFARKIGEIISLQEVEAIMDGRTLEKNN